MTIANNQNAPGAPGIDPRWAPGQKSAIGTASSDQSNVWFTIGQGIFNEIYYPRIDNPAIRDMGMIVTDGADYFSEEKTDTDSHVEWLATGIPAFRLTNASRDHHYQITKEVVADPKRSCVLQQTKFQKLSDATHGYKLFVLLAPHLNNRGMGNTAWIEDRHGQTILFAKREDATLALACSTPWLKTSAGYVGSSDGWQDLHQHKQMQWEYARAENGNVALTGEIDLTQGNEFTLALGFGKDSDEALETALASLQDSFESVKDAYISGWRDWQTAQTEDNQSSIFAAQSAAILRTHESKNPPGGIIAGLASPWGYSRGDDDPIGYHVVWTRDMVESAGGLLAAGKHAEVRRIIDYLESTQYEDGHWPQNMWLDGTPDWNGIQMDEAALPILLIDLARREDAIKDNDVIDFWPMIKRAASYLVQNGPVTQEDRWEEDPGYTPFTVAAEIAALLVAADIAELNREDSLTTYLRETADTWHDALDRWMYAYDTDWSKKYGVSGYYERISSVDKSTVRRFQNTVQVKNVPSQNATIESMHLVSPDALALVRFGLRDANDPRMVNTVRIIDELLKVDTPNGPTWHRYNGDGYGEHKDGSAFDGTGIGRGWPLLTGERAHYELAAGNTERAETLRNAMETLANDSGLLPEQVWDSQPIPEYGLKLGRPTGSATPLAWAHGEYLKLVRSLKDGKIFDQPPQTRRRYLEDKVVSPYRTWRFNHKIRDIQPSKTLRIETLSQASVHWTSDNWQTTHDVTSDDTGLGVYVADLDTAGLPTGTQIQFTFYWPTANKWEETNFGILVTNQKDA